MSHPLQGEALVMVQTGGGVRRGYRGLRGEGSGHDIGMVYWLRGQGITLYKRRPWGCRVGDPAGYLRLGPASRGG